MPYGQNEFNHIAPWALPARQEWHKNLPMHIGHVLKALRIQQGLTQEQLALEAELATSNVSRIERGLRLPTADLLRRMATVLGTSVSEVYAVVEGRAVGLAETIESYGSETQSLLRGFRELSPENQAQVLEYVKMLRRLQKRDTI